MKTYWTSIMSALGSRGGGGDPPVKTTPGVSKEKRLELEKLEAELEEKRTRKRKPMPRLSTRFDDDHNYINYTAINNPAGHKGKSDNYMHTTRTNIGGGPPSDSTPGANSERREKYPGVGPRTKVKTRR